MDIETALQMDQQQRTNQLESQLQSQIADVQKRIEQLSKLNADFATTTDGAKKLNWYTEQLTTNGHASPPKFEQYT